MRYRTLQALPSVTERYMRYRTLQNVTECYRTLLSVTEHYQALQNITKRYRALHILSYKKLKWAVLKYIYCLSIKLLFANVFISFFI